LKIKAARQPKIILEILRPRVDLDRYYCSSLKSVPQIALLASHDEYDPFASFPYTYKKWSTRAETNASVTIAQYYISGLDCCHTSATQVMKFFWTVQTFTCETSGRPSQRDYVTLLAAFRLILSSSFRCHKTSPISYFQLRVAELQTWFQSFQWRTSNRRGSTDNTGNWIAAISRA